jgi:hypothetical protein
MEIPDTAVAGPSDGGWVADDGIDAYTAPATAVVVVVVLVATPSAAAMFACVTGPSFPGLEMRIDTLRFDG